MSGTSDEILGKTAPMADFALGAGRLAFGGIKGVLVLDALEIDERTVETSDAS